MRAYDIRENKFTHNKLKLVYVKYYFHYILPLNTQIYSIKINYGLWEKIINFVIEFVTVMSRRFTYYN